MSESVRLIKKYPNRRLYDTKMSSYITLANVKQLVVGQTPFKVVDAKTGDDLTRSILLQIILEEESGGAPMFPQDVLMQFIRCYGSAMQGCIAEHLQRSIETMVELQREVQRAPGEQQRAEQPLAAEVVPGMQELMASYMEQSKRMLEQLRQQFQRQSMKLFASFQATAQADVIGPQLAGDLPREEPGR